MERLHGRVAVVTGAASGIGRAVATRAVAEGMRVVLADVDEPRLHAVRDELAAGADGGAEVVAVPTDVADAAAVARLADTTFDRFGAVHLLANHAGVLCGGWSWKRPLADWRWVLGVDLWGPIHTVHAFVGRMVEGGDEGHVVNGATVGALINEPLVAPYTTALRGVISLSESLFHELRLAGSRLGVSVVCPTATDTDLPHCERTRPRHLLGPAAPLDPIEQRSVEHRNASFARGTDPAVVADAVVAAVREGRFWVLGTTRFGPYLLESTQRLIEGLDPELDPGLAARFADVT
jgi:NAD(P)-dependent dehydrogenase (short-subunit alcohol dehydrogenase family)